MSFTQTIRFDSRKCKMVTTPAPVGAASGTAGTEYLIHRITDEDSKNSPVFAECIDGSAIFTPKGKLLAYFPMIHTDVRRFYDAQQRDSSAPTQQRGTLHKTNLIEGTTLVLFFDERIGTLGSWELATKNGVGANYWYYRNQYFGDTTIPQLTFRQMFLEAVLPDASVRASSNDDIPIEALNTALLNDLCEGLDKKYSYTVVVKHPANHIVNTVLKPEAYLISMYKTDANSAIDVDNMAEWTRHTEVTMLPNHITAKVAKNSLLDLKSIEYTSIPSRDTWGDSSVPGTLYVSDSTGAMQLVENPDYEKRRKLRGNHPNLFVQYLQMKQENRIREFLREFPRYAGLFEKFNAEVQVFVTRLHQGYVNYYIKKKGERIHKALFPYVYRLHHEIYLVSKTNGRPIIVTRSVVHNFVKLQKPLEVLHWIMKMNEPDTVVTEKAPAQATEQATEQATAEPKTEEVQVEQENIE